MQKLKDSCNIQVIPCTIYNSEYNFFHYYLEFLKPFHKLKNKEIDVLAIMLTHRYELSKSISNEDLLDTTLLSNNIKKLIREDAGITDNHLQTILTSFRKKGILNNTRIKRELIPSIKEGSDKYTLILNFNITYDR